MNTPCSQNPDQWFSTDPVELMEAAYECRSCPLMDSCRELAAGEVHGVWGGVIVGGSKTTKPPIDCDQCEREFIPKSTRQRFCSRSCQDRASVARARERVPVKIKTCEICSDEFPTRTDGRTCSLSCRNKLAAVERYRERSGALMQEAS